MNDRITPMRGFTCAVAAEQPAGSSLAHAGIAVGASGSGDDRRYAIALRHADGTLMTASLSWPALDRLTGLLADLVARDERLVPAIPHASERIH